MSDSVFDYDRPKRAPQQRARGYKFESRWHCSEIIGGTFEIRKSEAIEEIKRRILMFLGDEALAKTQYICVVLNCDSLVENVGEYEIDLRCYFQGKTQIWRSSLQKPYNKQNAFWEPIPNGVYNCENIRDENIEPPWEKIIIHGELLKSNVQKEHVSKLFRIGLILLT